MESSHSLPSETKVVVVGGGAVGASVAYHLASLGWRDVVLLEQNKLGAGTSWHAAGLVGRLRTSNSMTRINKYTVELYSQLEAETGHSVGWKQVGSLIVAKSSDRMIQLRRTMAMAEIFGVEAHLISPEAALEKWPLLRVDDVLGAAWLPHDGKVIPKEVPVALAKGARAHGATIIENIRVLQVEHQAGQVKGVKTNRGTIQAEYVVLCGGMWTRELGLRCGVTIPLGHTLVRAMRLTYVGELGWELHVATSQAASLYDALVKAGLDLGVTNAGHYAINSLRLEKGYRAWGVDISPDNSALEAGLGFAIAWKKSTPFLGREALLEQKDKGLKRLLLTFVLADPKPVLWGSEPIYRDGHVAGYTTSGSYGHTVGAGVGMGYIKDENGISPDDIRRSSFAIDVAGIRIPATAHLRSPYDPERRKILV